MTQLNEAFGDNLSYYPERECIGISLYTREKCPEKRPPTEGAPNVQWSMIGGISVERLIKAEYGKKFEKMRKRKQREMVSDEATELD
ncbi:hypothetical protein JTE90_010450 [Oedothorax gibbosus]|uniref:Uncharacterized protein n=1 Tax=Oedothorax gibbosus TaxID=931172 RepID=A0AAV6W2Q8_9ARAC|nr:hypothetical protein JTE90_010450 [Oedothorax gibbosus]